MEKESKPRFKPYEVFTKLMSLGKSMRTHCHRAIEADGFTLNETDVLLALTASPENNTVGAISESSNISKGNISQAVESLKQKGYLVTEQSSDDRRYVAVRLTEAADPVIEKLKAAEAARDSAVAALETAQKQLEIAADDRMTRFKIEFEDLQAQLDEMFALLAEMDADKKARCINALKVVLKERGL